MKRNRFDEDIIPSDLDSEHDNRMEEELEGFEEENIEELEQKSTDSEVEEPASDDVQCAEQRYEVEGQNERFEVEADAPLICAGECCKEIDPVQINRRNGDSYLVNSIKPILG